MSKTNQTTLSDEKVVSTEHLTYEQVQDCVRVILFSYWQKVHQYKTGIRFSVSPSQNSIEVINDDGYPIVSFRNMPLGKRVYHLLMKTKDVDQKEAFGYISSYVAQRNEDTLRALVVDVVDEHPSRVYPWPWGLDDDGRILLCKKGASIFLLPDSSCHETGWQILRNIISVKETSNPKVVALPNSIRESTICY